MKLEMLQTAKLEAMKSQDIARKTAINNMIDAIQKASITAKGRVEITETLINEVLVKHQKSIQEMIDTCPTNRTDLMDKYVAEMAVVKEFAPQLMTDPSEIVVAIHTVTPRGVPFVKSNKGVIMKAITPYFKGKADMKIVSQVVAEMLE